MGLYLGLPLVLRPESPLSVVLGVPSLGFPVLITVKRKPATCTSLLSFPSQVWFGPHKAPILAAIFLSTLIFTWVSCVMVPPAPSNSQACLRVAWENLDCPSGIEWFQSKGAMISAWETLPATGKEHTTWVLSLEITYPHQTCFHVFKMCDGTAYWLNSRWL